MRPLRHLLAQDSVALSLRELENDPETAYTRPDLENRLATVGVDAPALLVDMLLQARLLASYGPRLGISALGRRAHLLAEALDGADLEDVVRRLRLLTGQPDTYELVREGMTTSFIRSLVERPGFRRLYICSPWINPSEKDAATLKYAFYKALKEQEDLPEVYAILRPPAANPQETGDGYRPLAEIGAHIYFNPKVHTKLYIREPDRRGGAALAIVGSQNLTRSTSLELGLRINGDTRLIDKLIAYFHEIASRSTESAGEEE